MCCALPAFLPFTSHPRLTSFLPSIAASPPHPPSCAACCLLLPPSLLPPPAPPPRQPAVAMRLSLRVVLWLLAMAAACVSMGAADSAPGALQPGTGASCGALSATAHPLAPGAASGSREGRHCCAAAPPAPPPAHRRSAGALSAPAAAPPPHSPVPADPPMTSPPISHSIPTPPAATPSPGALRRAPQGPPGG